MKLTTGFDAPLTSPSIQRGEDYDQLVFLRRQIIETKRMIEASRRLVASSFDALKILGRIQERRDPASPDTTSRALRYSPRDSR